MAAGKRKHERHSWTPERVNAVLRMRDKGMTDDQIAEYYGMTKHGMNSAFRKAWRRFQPDIFATRQKIFGPTAE